MGINGGQVAILYSMIGEGLFEEMTFEIFKKSQP